MQHKTLTDREILNEIHELAADEGMDIESYIARLHSDCDSRYHDRYDGLPQNILDELSEARSSRIQQKRDELQQKRDATLKNDIKELLEHFPDITPDDIPHEVWQAVVGGTALKYAYALYLCDRSRDRQYADAVNIDAASRAASPAGKGECDDTFTPEMVEGMNRNDIKRNFKGILASIKKWKI